MKTKKKTKTNIKNNIDLYYKKYGSKNTETAIYIHGAGLDHKTWTPQTKTLKKQHQMILIDLPGHGETKKKQRKNTFTLQETIDEIHKLIQKLDLEKTTLIGQSLGGIISQHYTDQHPEKINKLILIGTPSLHHGFNKYIMTLLNIHTAATQVTPWEVIKKTAKSTFAQKPENKKYIEETYSKTGKKQLMNITKETKKTLTQGIQNPIQKPTLLIYGEKEMTLIKKQMIKWHQLHPNSKLKKIKNAAHLANQDNPKQVNKTIKNYLKNPKKEQKNL